MSDDSIVESKDFEDDKTDESEDKKESKENEKETLDKEESDDSEEKESKENDEDDSDGKENNADDTDNQSDDSLGYSEDDNSGDDDGIDNDSDGTDEPDENEVSELATQAANVFRGLSSSTEGFENQERIMAGFQGNLKQEWSDLLDEFNFQKDKSHPIGENPNDQPSHAIESISISEYGISDVLNKLSNEAHRSAVSLLGKISKNLTEYSNNTSRLIGIFSENLEKTIIDIDERVGSGETGIFTYNFGAYSRYFQAGGKSINTVQKLHEVSEQQFQLNKFLSTDAPTHQLECYESILIFLNSIKNKKGFNNSFIDLKKRLKDLDTKLHISLDPYLRKINTSYEAIVPQSIKFKKPLAKGKSLIALFDNNYYCTHEPKEDPTSLFGLINYGHSIERDLDAEKNPNTCINGISIFDIQKQLSIASKMLRVIKNYKNVNVRILEVVKAIEKLVLELTTSNNYELSDFEKREIIFLNLYLIESFTNPHITNIWIALRCVNISINISTTTVQTQTFKNFSPVKLGFNMSATSLINSLESLTNPDHIQANSNLVDIEEVQVDSTYVPEDVDVHPEDQAILDDSRELSQDATQLANSITSLESLRDQCRQLIKYGTPSEQRKAIASIHTSHVLICQNLGIKQPSRISLEDYGDEVQALEGIFESIGNTVKGIAQSFKNVWGKIKDYFKNYGLRASAAKGDIRARLALIKQKMHLLEHVRGEEFNDPKVIANLGLWSKFSTPISAVVGTSEIHSDHVNYINGSYEAVRELLRNVKNSDAEKIMQTIEDEINSYVKTVFFERKNSHAITPRIGKDQSVYFSRLSPGNSVSALVVPNEIIDKSTSVDRIKEINYCDLSSGVRRDIPKTIECATENDVSELEREVELWNKRAYETGSKWEYMSDGYDEAETLAHYIYHNTNGRQKDAANAATAIFNFFGTFYANALNANMARAILAYTVVSAALTWIEMSIEKAEQVIKTKPAV